MTVFELQATFQADPPQEPEPLSFYVIAEQQSQAIDHPQAQGSTCPSEGMWR